jgi:hypothetical protein
MTQNGNNCGSRTDEGPNDRESPRGSPQVKRPGLGKAHWNAGEKPCGRLQILCPFV